MTTRTFSLSLPSAGRAPRLTHWLLMAALWLSAGPALAQQSPRPSAAGQLPAQARKALYSASFEQHAARLYARAGLGPTGLTLPVFREGLVGYYNLQAAAGKGRRTTRPVLTLIDFARPSHQKRLWVINIAEGRLLFHTLVAHGRGTGDVEPVAFSNLGGSNQSSLGFYRTAAATYEGKHGTSLKINGLDPGFNTNAESRAVVVHGAEYVCEDFIKQHGHLGRSQGCPALPVAQTKAIIQAIKGNSIMYLHGPAAARYRSKWLNVDTAVEIFAQTQGLAVR
ncbi:murein L,D-transpeptidase catalytic domain family protein [uncultured Hymenobacter sp.]|uniref:murein L,D-transpeptidase catalytic domain family protein n=1 Tax=uncultured Hymenobacter sp. TaxID=170016 RepID=UPI0035C99AAB